MISFLNPGFLWVLPLAASPILLHFLFLRRARRVPFSDLTLLEAAYLRALASSRLRQWLLLTARCLLILFLVLAFARPVLEASGSAKPGTPESAVRLALLLDRSYSMRYQVDGKTRFETAVAAGRSILRSFGPQDRVAIVPFSDRAELGSGGPVWMNAGQAAAALSRFEPGFGGTDYLAALSAAYDFLAKGPKGVRVILVLSDNAAHGWRDMEPSHWNESVPGFDSGVSLLGLTWPDAPENAAVLDAQPGPVSPDGAQALTVKAGAFGKSRRDWELSLWQGSRREEEKRLNLDLGSIASANFLLRSPNEATSVGLSAGKPGAYSAGAFWGRLQLREDSLAEDDGFFYSLWTQPRPRVLLAYGGSRSMQVGRGGYFLGKLFLDPRGSLLPFEIDTADQVRLGSIRLEDYRAIVLLDFRAVPPALGPALARFVRGGGGLWMIPGPWENSEAYRPLSPVLPVRWLNLLEFNGEGGLKPQSDASSTAFSWRGFDPASISVRRGYLLAPEPGARVLIRDSASRPLLIAADVGAGRSLVFASSLDLDWTNLALKPAFAPWVNWALGLLTGYSDRRQWRTVRLGEKFSRVWRPEEPAPSSVRIMEPDRRVVSVQVLGRRMEFEPDKPGLYFIEGSSGVDVFAANLDRSKGESNLSFLSTPPWRAVKAGSAQEDFKRSLYGVEARTACLAAALALLLAETLLAGAPRGLNRSIERTRVATPTRSSSLV